MRAFARIAAAHPDLQLVLAGGDGWGVAEARAAIEASGVATRILRPGYVDNATLAALFRRAEVIAYPSLVEGFGLPALEALAVARRSSRRRARRSTRSSATPRSSSRPAIRRAWPGAPCSSSSTTTLVAARLRRDGPERAATFTWERSIDAHIEAYRRAIGHRAPGRGGVGTAVPG